MDSYRRVNVKPDPSILEAHFRDAVERAGTTLLRSTPVFDFSRQQLDLLWRKFENNIVADAMGVEQDPSKDCWILLPPTKPPASEYVRLHDNVKRRRGPYTMAGYSFADAYPQTTYTRRDHAALGLPESTFPSCRTVQCTHVALLRQGQSPPAKNRQLYTASHLCGKPACMRHLVWELLDVNYSRRMCHVYGGYDICPHMPHCMLRILDHKQ